MLAIMLWFLSSSIWGHPFLKSSRQIFLCSPMYFYVRFLCKSGAFFRSVSFIHSFRNLISRHLLGQDLCFPLSIPSINQHAFICPLSSAFLPSLSWQPYHKKSMAQKTWKEFCSVLHFPLYPLLQIISFLPHSTNFISSPSPASFCPSHPFTNLLFMCILILFIHFYPTTVKKGMNVQYRKMPF